MVVFHKSIESRPARMLPVFSLDPNFSLFRTGLFPAWAPQGDRVILAESPGLLVMDVRRESITDIYPSKGLYDSMGKQLGALRGHPTVRPSHLAPEPLSPTMPPPRKSPSSNPMGAASAPLPAIRVMPRSRAGLPTESVSSTA